MNPLPGQPSTEETQLHTAIIVKEVMDQQRAKEEQGAKAAAGPPKPPPQGALDRIDQIRRDRRPHDPPKQHMGFVPWLARKLNLR